MAAPRRAKGRTWAEVRVLTSTGAADAVGAMLWNLGVAGVIEERIPPSAVRLRCYLPPSRVRRITLQRLRFQVRELRRFGLDPGAAAVSARPIAGIAWARAWRASLRPVRVGRLIIRPTWMRAPIRAGRIGIRIDPGMAFGTGAHASTRLCLRALLRHLPRRTSTRPPTVVDVGTGSGILAIAAARLGAGRVWARDTDPLAVAVARENVRANGVAGVVRVVRGAGLSQRPARADLIVANIVAETIIALLPSVHARLAHGGLFVGSGVVEDRLPEVLAAASAASLKTVEVLTEGEWRAVVLARRIRRTSPSRRAVPSAC